MAAWNAAKSRRTHPDTRPQGSPAGVPVSRVPGPRATSAARTIAPALPDDRKNRILGDRTVVCPRCGFARRYLAGTTSVDDDTCPDCGTPLVKECRACGEPLESAMQVDCRACGAPLRDPELFGVPIRRKPEPKRAAPLFDDD